MPDSEKEVIKSAMKEAMKEWLDARYAEFGVFSFRMIGAAFILAIVYFMLKMNGWKHV